MDGQMFDSILEIILTIQSAIIIIGSVVVLQGVLNQCSNMLRLSFVIFPVGSSLGFLDMMYDNNIHLSGVILNTSIMLILYWMWSQKDMFFDLHQLMKNKESNTPYSFTSEMKAILSCFAIWVITKVNPKLEDRCVVCKQMIE